MTVQYVPVANGPNLYVDGLGLTWASSTVVGISNGAARNSTNVTDLSINPGINCDITVSGINGLDTGTVAANTWYYMHIVGDSGGNHPTGVMYSTSRTAPTLPAGYDSFRALGAVLTDGSSNILKFYASNGGDVRTFWWDVMISVSGAGLTATTLTAVSLASAVPAFNNTQVYLWGSFTPNAAGDRATFRISGSSATTPLFSISSVVASKAQDVQFKFFAGTTQSMDYEVAASGSLALSVQGWEFAF